MYRQNPKLAYIILLMIMSPSFSDRTSAGTTRIIQIAKGWARNSVNAAVFGRNSIVTHENTQYVAFYDESANVVLAKRRIETQNWEIRTTQCKGNARDAHNSISIMLDGDGFLHVSWDQHNSPFRYCRSAKPGSLELIEQRCMTGKKERSVTYPEFYRLPDGTLIFMYRDGSSGSGNVMMNRYDTRSKVWSQLQDGFINGEGQRSAYWQATIDTEGTIHISWVWKETWDVATNHDICYAKSMDGERRGRLLAEGNTTCR